MIRLIKWYDKTFKPKNTNLTLFLKVIKSKKLKSKKQFKTVSSNKIKYE